MKSCTRVLGIVAVWICAAAARGDGKVYFELEEVPAHIPYQRALILFDEGRQTLVLQSKVEMEATKETPAPLAWVVPVPSVPELDSFSAPIAQHMFLFLGLRSSSDVIPLRWIFYVAALVASIVWIFYCLRMPGWRHLGLALFVFLILWIFPAIFMPASSSAGGVDEVEIIEAAQVGIHDVQVIRSDNSSALLEWLTENGFAFSHDDLPVLDRYVERGWCFVVSKVGAADAAAHRVEGLIDPLVMRFESERPVYPLALTATQGVDTQVLVYLLAERKMVCEAPLKLRYAGKHDRSILITVEGMTIFQPWERDLSYLHRFRSKLSPKDMKEDAFFVSAEDNETFRETVVRW